MPQNKNQEIARQLFLRLVTLGEGTEDTRRRALQSELYSLGGDEMHAVIRAFDESRLLTFDRDPLTREPTVELAHEAIIREWSQLRTWLDESRDDVRQQRLLAAAASEWRKNNQDTSYLLSGARLAQFEEWYHKTGLALTEDEHAYLHASFEESQHQRARERRTQRILQGLVALFLVAAVIGVGLAVFASAQRNRAEDARDNEAAARATSDANSVRAEREAENAINARATSDANSIRAEQEAENAINAQATSVANAQAALNAQATSIANANAAQQLALVNGAQAALAKGDRDTALALAIVANRNANPSAQAQLVLSEAAYPPGTIRLFQGHTATPMRLAISSDGTKALSGGTDGLVILWEVATGEQIYRFDKHTNWVVDVGISPDGTTGFSLSWDRTIILWDLVNGQMIRQMTTDKFVSTSAISAAFTPDGRTIITNNGGGIPTNDAESKLLLWDVDTGRIVREFAGLDTQLGGVAISPDGSKVLSGTLNGEMILWDMESGEIIQRFSDNSTDWREWPSEVAFSPDGHLAFVTAMNTTTVVWDLETYQVLHRFGTRLPGENWDWRQTAPSHDGHMTISNDAEVSTVWNVESGQAITTLGCLPRTASSAVFVPNQPYVLVGRQELRLCDWQNGAEIRNFAMGQETPLVNTINTAEISNDGRTLAIAEQLDPADPTSCTLLLFDVATGTELRRFAPPVPLNQVECGFPFLDFSPDNRSLISSSQDGRVTLWDVSTGNLLHTFAGHIGFVYRVVFSPDGHTFVSGGGVDGVIILWDVASRKEIRRFVGHTADVLGLAFSPDGQTLLSSSEDSSMILWDVNTGAELRRFEIGEVVIITVTISPDGRMVVTGDSDNQVSLWDLATGQKLHTLVGHADAVNSLNFSSDGQTIFSIANDAVIVWDMQTNEAIRRYQPGGYDLSISLDGDSLFYVGMDSVVHQLRIDSHDELMAWTLDNRYVRDLTCTERALYRLDPPCNPQGIFPTATPFSTALPTATLPPVPTVDPERITPTMTVTATPSLTPRPMLQANLGDNRGRLLQGGYEDWKYMGQAGEVLTIRVSADLPANWSTRNTVELTPEDGLLDTLVLVTAPDGSVLNYQKVGGAFTFNPLTSNDIDPGVNTDSLISGLVLPVDGVYVITVSGYNFEANLSTGGGYTLTIESQPPAIPSPETSPPRE